jgi:hypothetical protein
MDMGKFANTHLLYSTIGHEHLDGLVSWARQDYPDSALMLVECEDGRWFIEVEFGSQYNGIEGVSRPDVGPYTPPNFYASEDEALAFAIGCIKQIHPELASRNLLEYYADED